ncbi:MAG: C-GCAxxG-C-C family (seleno)protein [Candidatus Odinarchaeota archaeon]
MKKSSDNIIDLTMSVRNDYNCAQATAYGILSYFDHHFEAETLAKSFVPYGGGVGEGSICGAVLGSLAGLSRILNDKNMIYDDIVKAGTSFKQLVEREFDSYYCKELMKEFSGKEPLTEEMRAKRSQKCSDVIKFCVKTIQSLVENI